MEANWHSGDAASTCFKELLLSGRFSAGLREKLRNARQMMNNNIFQLVANHPFSFLISGPSLPLFMAHGRSNEKKKIRCNTKALWEVPLQKKFANTFQKQDVRSCAHMGGRECWGKKAKEK